MLAGDQTAEASEALHELLRRARQAELDSEAAWRHDRAATDAARRYQLDEELRRSSDEKAAAYERRCEEELRGDLEAAERREGVTEADGLLRALDGIRARS